MKEKLKNLFKKKNKENVSEEVQRERQSLIDKQEEVIKNYQDVYQKNTKEIQSIEDKDAIDSIINNGKKEELQEEITNAKMEVVRLKQGSIKDIISTYFGQIDKKIYNILFKEIKEDDGKKHPIRKVINSIHDKYSDMRDKRYKDLSSYITKNSLISIIVLLISVVGNYFIPGLGNFIKMIHYGNGLFMLNTIIKGISTKYNNKFFNGPLMNRMKNLFHGKYKENVETAKMVYEHIKDIDTEELVSKLEEFKDDFDDYEDEDTKGEELEHNEKDVKEENVEHEEEKPLLDGKRDLGPIADFYKEPERVTPKNVESLKPRKYRLVNQMRNFGNIGMVMPEEGENLAYIDAYSAIRKSDDNDYRIEAYAKLATTFGRNINKKTDDSNLDKLNSYARMLKELSIYGRKIHSGTATKEDNAMYMNLLYRLGKDFDDEWDITDYLSDQYDEYVNAKENGRVYRKVYRK